MSNNKPEVTFKYIFTYDYNPVFINGAHGGVTPRGKLAVDFYQERAPLPNSVTHQLNPNGTIGSEVAVEPEDLNQSLVRFVAPESWSPSRPHGNFTTGWRENQGIGCPGTGKGSRIHIGPDGGSQRSSH